MALRDGDWRGLGALLVAASLVLTAASATAETIAQRRGLVERMLRAYAKGARDYHDAFAGPDDTRRDGPTAPEIIAIIARHVGQTPEQVKAGLLFIDGAARDVERQIAWYKGQGMIKGAFTGADVVDKSLIVPLP